MSCLTLSGIVLRYADAPPVLDGIDLALESGEIVVVIGGSGSGKTSLLRLAAGFQAASAGRIDLDGRAVTGPGAERAVVFQHDALFPWLSVAENVAFALRLRGLSAAERRAQAQDWLDLVGLSALGARRIWEISGGQRQRVGIARALIAEPAFLLMDEPFAALDALTRAQMQRVLLEIWHRTGKGILFITHDIDEALMLATRLVLLGGGRLRETHALPFSQRLAAGESPRAIRHDPAFAALREHLVDRLDEASPGPGDAKGGKASAGDVAA